MGQVIQFPLRAGRFVIAGSVSQAEHIARQCAKRRCPSMGHTMQDAALLLSLHPGPMRRRLGLYWVELTGPVDVARLTACKLLIAPER